MEIGRGGFARVTLAADGSAVKHVLPAGREQLQKEHDLLAYLKDEPHVIRVLGIVHDKFESQLWMQYGGAELLVLLLNHRLTFAQKQDVLLQVYSAVASLHAKDVAHMDLKPENILVDAAGRVRLIDFNLSRKVDGTMVTERMGSKSYCCPEVIQGVPYSAFQADVWSLGILTTVLYTDHLPWNHAAVSDARYRLFLAHDGVPSRGLKYVFPPYFSELFHPEMLLLLDGMLCVRPEDRMSRWKFSEALVK